MIAHTKVSDYFRAEERGDIEAVVAMCADDIIVRNAANQPQHGREGARAYVTSFSDRTASRRFEVLSVAVQGDVVYALWRADLTFRAGVAFGPVTTTKPFDLSLPGICRFKLNEAGLFTELDVMHETTTAVRLAQQAADAHKNDEPVNNTLLQLGHSRDGGRYYLDAARNKGWRCELIETEAGAKSIEWGDLRNTDRYDAIHFVRSDEEIDALASTLKGNFVAVVAGFELFRLDAYRIAHKLGVATYDDATVLTRLRLKSAQRMWLAENAPHVRQPRFHVCNTLDDAIGGASQIGYPAVVKPADSGGSDGVSLVRDQAELLKAVRDLQANNLLDDGRRANGEFLVEEVIDGPEMGVQGVVDVNGGVQVLSVSTKELDTADGRFLERRHFLLPPSMAPHVVEFAEETIRALGLRGSAFHMDVRLRDSTPILIEAGARLSGAYIPMALSVAGVHWAKASLSVAAGSASLSETALRKFVTIELLTADSFSNPGLLNMRSAPGIESIVLVDMQRASQGGSYTHFADRVGVRISCADTADDAKEAALALL